MSIATADPRPAGRQTVLASYDTADGRRQLVGQRIDGRVALSDLPSGEHGKVYLVERHLTSQHELAALLADYLALANQLGRPPLERDWIFSE